MSDTSDQGPGWGTPPPPPGAPVPPPAPPGWQAPPPGPTPPPPGSTAPPLAYGTPPPAPGYPPSPAYPPAQPYPAQPYPAQGYGAPYGQPPRNEPLAIAALVCGIVAIPLCLVGVIPGALAIAFGLISIRRIRDSQGALTGRGMALAGAICGGVGVTITVLYLIAVIVGTFTSST